MRSSLKGSALALAAFGALAIAAPSAWAGCGEMPKIKPAAFAQAAAGLPPVHLLRVAATPSMVGMWRIQFFSGSNQIDFGFSQWHSDGTEIMNSGGRAPATENFCLGVWAQTGTYTYKLNHYALSYDPTTGDLNGRDYITENITLDPTGSKFSGSFTIDAYAADDTTLEAHVAGHITGQRLTVN